MSTWKIEYTYTDNSTGRDQHRAAHRQYLADQSAAGALLAYGRYEDDGPAAALLVAQAESEADVRALVAGDPFEIEGLIERVDVRNWAVTWATSN